MKSTDMEAVEARLRADATHFEKRAAMYSPVVLRSPVQIGRDLTALLSAYQERGRALEWYGEQARLSRLIHSEGDAGRHALADDGGRRARALTPSGAVK